MKKASREVLREREKKYEVSIGGVDDRAGEELTEGGMAGLGRGAGAEKVQGKGRRHGVAREWKGESKLRDVG